MKGGQRPLETDRRSKLFLYPDNTDGEVDLRNFLWNEKKTEKRSLFRLSMKNQPFVFCLKVAQTVSVQEFA